MNQMIRQNPKRQAAQLSKQSPRLFKIEVVKSGVNLFKGYGVYPSSEAANRSIFNIFGGTGALINVSECGK